MVDDYSKGMATTVMLPVSLLTGHPTAEDLCEMLARYYEGVALVQVQSYQKEAAYLAANTMAGKDSLTLVVSGHEEQIIVTPLFDNLGKGASGAAVQNMNLMLGFPETTGLSL